MPEVIITQNDDEAVSPLRLVGTKGIVELQFLDDQNGDLGFVRVRIIDCRRLISGLTFAEYQLDGVVTRDQPVQPRMGEGVFTAKQDVSFHLKDDWKKGKIYARLIK